MAKNIKNTEGLERLTAYEIVFTETLKDINSLGVILKHKKSGAKVAIVSNNDTNKVFNIGFRTPPKDSTGVAHIIEHTVLCGSKAFPAKDPFIELTKGTLNTFLNAMTYPEKTLYPIASYNDTDFQNLMHVYLDAVFYPNIYYKREIFEQEGWHYELKDENDELTYNGVVYNEMKGVYSNPDSLLGRITKQALYPDTCYGVDSGGNPDSIPDLSYEEYLEFHRKYYHPSNSYVYLYGDMDVEEKLIFMDEHYFCHFNEAEVDSRIKEQTSFTKTRRFEKSYSIGMDENDANKTYIGMCYSIGDCLDPKLCVTLSILEYVLFSAPGAPIKQALLDANICEDVVSMEESQVKYPYMYVFLKNSEEASADTFVSVLNQALETIVQTGIDEKSLRAAINVYEFQYREADFGQFPKGLMYSLSVMASWMNYEKAAFDSLKENEVYAQLKQLVGTGYYEEFIKKYLLQNKHSSLVIFKPQKGLNDEKERMLKEKLQAYKESLTKEEVQKIIEDTKHLIEYQETPSTPKELEMIPILSRDDINKQARPFANEEHTVDGIKVLHHDIFTNGIIYLRLLFRLDHISQEYTSYLGLLNTVIGYIDLKNRSYLDFSNDVNIVTGGMSSAILTFGKKGNSKEFTPMLCVSSRNLDGNTKKTFDLIKEMIQETRLDDTKRLQEILFEVKARLETKLVSNGHTTAADRAISYYSREAAYEQDYHGISYYYFIKDLLDHFEERKENLVVTLTMLMKEVFRKENLMVSVTTTKDLLDSVLEELPDFSASLYTEPMETKTSEIMVSNLREGFKTSSQVQYVACAGNIFDEGFQYLGTLKVLRTILGYDYLWNNVRVKGGAYGCMCAFSGVDGNCYFTSYRDPNLEATLEAYQKAADYVEQFAADDREMDKYVIGTMSTLDTPLTPASDGLRSLTAYLTGTTFEDIQKERNEVLGVSVENIRELSKIVRAIIESGHLCVIGNDKKIDENAGLFTEIKQL